MRKVVVMLGAAAAVAASASFAAYPDRPIKLIVPWAAAATPTTSSGAGAVTALAASASFAAYPDRPVKLIVPWAAGGDTDNIFRPFAPLFQKQLGQPVVIANVGGASGTKGATEAKDSPADGYTLYAVHDYIHSTYYTGVADVNYMGLRADLPDQLDRRRC